MCSGKILSELRDEPTHVKIVFVVSEMLANRQPTVWRGKPIAAGEFITSLASMMRYCSTTHKQTRFAFKRLQELDLLKLNTEERVYTRVELLTRGTEKGTRKGTEKVTAKPTKIRIELESEGTEKGTRKGTEKVNSSSGVDSAVGCSSGVDVSPSGSSVIKKGTMSATPTSPRNPDQFKDDYNKICTRLIECRTMTTKRRKALAIQMREFPLSGYWAEVLNVANRSAFLAGDNERKWKADIEFIIRKHVEIVEGKYSRKPPVSASPPRERIVEAERPLTEAEEEINRQGVLAQIAEWRKKRAPTPVSAPAKKELDELPV